MANPDVPSVLDYASPTARVSRMAEWSMILGIISIPTICLLIGPFIGLIALILGLVSGWRIARNPGRLAGAGMATTGSITGVASMAVVLLIAIMMPSLSGGHVLADRAACAANVTGTVKGFVVYANDNDDVYPTPGLPPADKAYATSFGTLSTATDPDTALTQAQSTPGAQGNPASAIWMLVLRSQMTPKNMICKKDPGASSTPAPITDSAGRYFLNPTRDNQVSYSIAYPYASATSVGAWWKNTTLSDLPLMSDIAPRSGTGSPKRNVAPVAAPSDVKTVNSGNHLGEGQNVGYADGHCEWRTTPLCGQGGENIWTVGTALPAVAGYGGSVITGGGVPNYPPSPPATSATTEPATAFDMIMVPVRDLDGGAIK